MINRRIKSTAPIINTIPAIIKNTSMSNEKVICFPKPISERDVPSVEKKVPICTMFIKPAAIPLPRSCCPAILAPAPSPVWIWS